MPKECLGTVYYKCSEDFMRGIYPIARTVKAEQHDLVVVEMEVRQLGNLTENAKRENPNQRRVYDSSGLSPALTSGMGEGGNLQPFIIAAMRGRNPDNPSDRTAGSPTEQRLEPNSQGICNTLSSVQKDNMVLESKTREHKYRIRKLTPLECWRLMGFSDEDFQKAAEVNSNSQLYKQAGNSIVKNVLMAILGQMIPGKERIYRNPPESNKERNHSNGGTGTEMEEVE